MKYDVFISYRRDGGEFMAKILRDRLQELGYAVFFDVESLRSGDFNTKLYSVIDECSDFLLILSPNALDRCRNDGDWVRREVEYALEKEKNIIPVMLRGFSFPESLPDTLDALRYKNGIEANSQFFDAFIRKLQQFLIAKPPIRQRVAQNTVFRRTLPLLITLLILLLLGSGAVFAVNLWNRSYPRTKAEKNLTAEAVYYIESNLTRLELLADAASDALQASRQYLYSGETNYSSVRNQLTVSRQTFLQTDLSACSPSEGFIGRLSESPFPVNDFIALYDSMEAFRSEWEDNIAYFEWLVGPTSIFSSSDKLNILDHYQIMLDETLQINAYGCNEMLLCVTDDTALDAFLYQYLPEVPHIPLSPASWSGNKALLESGQEESFRKIETAVFDLGLLTGNLSTENSLMAENLRRTYMELGFTREQAEEYVDRLLRNQAGEDDKKYEALLPEEGDSLDLLWAKMITSFRFRRFGEALNCVDAIRNSVKDADPCADAYVSALYLFIADMRLTGIDYGVMVTGYYEPDGINEVLRAGDIIIEFNGIPCHNSEEYMEWKSQLTEPEYNVLVLRAAPGGRLEQVLLELTADMPRVGIRSLSGER